MTDHDKSCEEGVNGVVATAIERPDEEEHNSCNNTQNVLDLDIAPPSSNTTTGADSPLNPETIGDNETTKTVTNNHSTAVTMCTAFEEPNSNTTTTTTETINTQVPMTFENGDTHTASDDECATNEAVAKLQSMLQEHIALLTQSQLRADAAEERCKDYDIVVSDRNEIQQQLNTVKDQISNLTHEKQSLELEMVKLREIREEHDRKEILLSSRVNDAKKKEALKANLAEKLLVETKSLQEQLNDTKKELQTIKTLKEEEASSNAITLAALTERLTHADSALADERRLNEERKKKMKVFVESKQDELRQARAQCDELNLELSQTNRSMREHHTRWKQLHAQWVQSQTRNRELQRELHKLEKDQETANRMGDKMELQMAKSAQETTLHKTKRLTAKHELMTVLRTLDGERELSGKLRDSIKFTFTPKALSQQQLMKEALKDLERELLQLSRRLGRPLPPVCENSFTTLVEDDEEEEDTEDIAGKRSRSEIDTDHLLSNLEEETQRVSQGIMALGSSIERMHMVLSEHGERNCVGVLHDILSAASGGQSYGQVRTHDMT